MGATTAAVCAAVTIRLSAAVAGGNGTAILASKPVYHPGTVISIH